MLQFCRQVSYGCSQASLNSFSSTNQLFAWVKLSYFCNWWPRHLSRNPPPPSTSQPTATSSQTVSIATAQIAPTSLTIAATGTVAARDLLPIAAEASGLQVQQVLVDEGQSVRAGQPLAILNSDVLRTQLNQSQAQYNSARAVLGQRQATLRRYRQFL